MIKGLLCRIYYISYKLVSKQWSNFVRLAMSYQNDANSKHGVKASVHMV